MRRNQRHATKRTPPRSSCRLDGWPTAIGGPLMDNPPLLPWAAQALRAPALPRTPVFKNLIVYRIGPDWTPSHQQAEDGLSQARFVECGATQPAAFGWVEPRGTAHGPLLEIIGGQWLLKMMVEQKMVPGPVIKRRTDEMAQQIELQTGRKPGKKQAKELKEQALLELLPMAFTKQARVNVWIDPTQRLLMVDAGSAKRAEEVVTALVKALPGLAVQPLQTRMSAPTAMAHWLASGEPPAGFSIDRECELKSPDEMKSVVRYARHALDIDEVRQHIAAGKQPTRLALTWAGRVSFVLTEAMTIKKIGFEDVVFESHKGSAQHQDESFDADAAIATGELVQLIPDLVEALDGELQPGELPTDLRAPDATAPAPAPLPPASVALASDDTPPWA